MRRAVALATGSAIGLALLALAVAGAVVSLGCGSAARETVAGAGRWEPAALSLPSGHRMSAYDAASDTLWIVTADYTSRSDAILTEFHPDTGQSSDYTIPGTTNWLGYGDAVAVDAQGMVWAAWGQRLVQFDARTSKIHEWALPEAVAPDSSEPTDVGVAVDLAVEPSGRVWVVRDAVDLISVLDPDSGSWDGVLSGGVRGTFASNLTIRSDGSAFLNGVLADSEWALAKVDPAAKEGSLTEAAAAGYAALQDGAIAYLDARDGKVKRLNPETDELEDISSAYSAPVQNWFTADATGAVWFWNGDGPGRELVWVSPTGQASSFPYPLIVHDSIFLPTGFYGSPTDVQKSVSDPRIQSIAVDKRGDVWVLSGHEGDPGGYPVLYRLDPDA